LRHWPPKLIRQQYPSVYLALKKASKTKQKCTRKLIKKNYAMLLTNIYLILHIDIIVKFNKKTNK